MSALLAVDPSLRCTGWAYFYEGQLEACGYIEPPSHVSRIEAVRFVFNTFDISGHFDVVDETVLEFPRIYPKGAQAKRTDHVDPNDLLWVAAVAGAVAQIGSKATTYYPSDWKGQTKKEKTLRLVFEACSPEERRAIERVTGHKRHNAVDAVGIGMYHLKRIGRNVLRELP